MIIGERMTKLFNIIERIEYSRKEKAVLEAFISQFQKDFQTKQESIQNIVKRAEDIKASKNRIRSDLCKNPIEKGVLEQIDG